MNNINLYGPYEGYIKGNIFKNLFNNYKNYKIYNPKVFNEEDELLLNINQICFYRHELNLLLDNYPNNKEILDLFNKYLEVEQQEINNYERRYGPLTVNSEMNNIPFKWESTKWPWDN